MDIQEISKKMKSLSNKDIIREYDNHNDYLLSDPHDEDSLLVQHLFQIEMSQRFIDKIEKLRGG